MSLSSFFQRFRRDGQAAGPADLQAPPPMDVEVARTRARRRLIGMLVLVVAGVLVFPWLFETQPRPLSQDVQIVQAPGAGGVDASGATGQSASRSVAGAPISGRVGVATINPPVAEPASAEREIVESPEPASAATEVASTPEAHGHGKAVAAGAVAVGAAAVIAKAAHEPKVVAAKPAHPADKALDKKAVEARPADHKPAAKGQDKKSEDKKADDKKVDDKAKASTRYVVQFGAFADNAAAQAARAKVEKLGIKTYAQTVDTPAGKRTRVRIGPFADKAEADKANATLRKAGLTGSVLTL